MGGRRVSIFCKKPTPNRINGGHEFILPSTAPNRNPWAPMADSTFPLCQSSEVEFYSTNLGVHRECLDKPNVNRVAPAINLPILPLRLIRISPATPPSFCTAQVGSASIVPRPRPGNACCGLPRCRSPALVVAPRPAWRLSILPKSPMADGERSLKQ